VGQKNILQGAFEVESKEMILVPSLVFVSKFLLNAMIMQGDLLFLHNVAFKPDFTNEAFTSDYV